MKDIQIKYSAWTVSLVTVVLTILCSIFLNIISEFSVIRIGEMFTIFSTVLFIFVLTLWVNTFLLPLILKKPALIIHPEYLYITAIKQSIPWSEVEQTNIKYTINNHVISIFVKDADKIFVKPSSCVHRFNCAMRNFISDTPFGFSTFPIEGKAVDIYNKIKSGLTKAKLTKTNF